MRMFLQVPWGAGACFLQNFYQLEQQYQYMSMVASWQRAAFQQELRVLLAHIAGEALNFLEFQLLVQQGNIFFCSREDEQRCQQLFRRELHLMKGEIVQLLSLVGTRVLHARQQYIVRLRRSRDQLLHSRLNCFRFWKERMAQRYGHVHEWFEALCQERDIRRVSLPRFLTHLDRVLQDTPHRHCAKNVSLSFAKTRKNEVELSVFMNTILIDSRSTLGESRTRQTRAKSAVLSSTRKKGRYEDGKDGKESTAACSSNKGGFQSLRDIVPMRSMSKYFTPKVKIKTYNSLLVVE